MKSFSEIVAIVEARQSGASWLARCKAHDDRNPSLSVTEGDDGRTLFRCHAGCSAEAVLSAFGLTWEDVMPERTGPRERPGEYRHTWEIRNVAGELVAEHVRIEEPGRKKRFTWRRNGKSGLGGLPASSLPLYRSERIPTFNPGKLVVLTEGEKAADAAEHLGLQALGTVCGASATPGRDALAVLADRQVVLWPDYDEPGIEHMRRIAEELAGVAKTVRWLHQPDARPKDDAADYQGTLVELKRAVYPEPPDLSTPLVMLGDSVAEALRELDKLHAGDLSDFVSTGLQTLDRKMGGGFRRGHVVLIGAPTGSGKTSLVTHFAMAAQEKGLAIIVSPEMSTRELAIREIVRRSERPKWHRTPWTKEWKRDEAKQLHDVAGDSILVQQPKVAVYDSLDVRLEDVLTAARAASRKGHLSLIALDYAQQLADESSMKSRHLLVGEVGHKAVAMAREFNCPVVVTSQVNVFKDGQRGKEYSFRESQILEHKAHTVLLFVVERDQYGRVEKATFRARKARDLGLFELDVDFHPATFTIADKAETPEVRDWTTERDEEQGSVGWGLG